MPSAETAARSWSISFWVAITWVLKVGAWYASLCYIHPKLRQLGLNHTYLRSEGVMALATVLERGGLKSLEILQLAGNGIGDGGWLELAKGLGERIRCKAEILMLGIGCMCVWCPWWGMSIVFMVGIMLAVIYSFLALRVFFSRERCMEVEQCFHSFDEGLSCIEKLFSYLLRTSIYLSIHPFIIHMGTYIQNYIHI